ncbi:hypothetical protein RMCBS344292_02518 [Rhizopus microsporus]|nr:hypothetical protein RMCBS344292_02518 [Rhizopus microsporus]
MPDFKVEHPLHSYVLSIDDQLNSMFTADEIKEIKKESGFTDMSKSLPESLVNILMKLKGKIKLFKKCAMTEELNLQNTGVATAF